MPVCFAYQAHQSMDNAKVYSAARETSPLAPTTIVLRDPSEPDVSRKDSSLAS
jgi:hypothetical protein